MCIAIIVLPGCLLLLALVCLPRLVLEQKATRDFISRHNHDCACHNLASTSVGTMDRSMLRNIVDFLRGSPDRTPAEILPAVTFSAVREAAGDQLLITGLGHSTCHIPQAPWWQKT